MNKLRVEGVLTDAQKEKIHRSAVSLLERLGFLCNHPQILESFHQAGCKLGDEMSKPKGARVVKFSEEIIADALDKAPSEFTLYPYVPGCKELKWGSGGVHIGISGGMMTWDLQTGKYRDAELRDFPSACRVIDACENFDAILGYPFYHANDLATKEEIHEITYMSTFMEATTMLHTGKPHIRIYLTSTKEELDDALKLYEIAAGGREAFRKKPNGAIMASPTSPLSLIGCEEGEALDWADWVWAAIQAGVPLPVAPCGIMGGTAPVSVSGTIVQNVAEFLALLVAIQTANPGHPVAFGDFSGSMDMLTGEKATHRPESLLVHLGSSEMARYYNKPSLWDLGSAESPLADAQVAWERTQSYLTAFLSGKVDVVMSGGGMGYLRSFDIREVVIENEIISRIKHMVKGINFDEESIPLDQMIETGFGATGASFLKTVHTKKYYKSEQWKRSSLTSALNADKWIDKGQKSLLDRSEERVQEILEKHEPDIPEGYQKEIRAFLQEVLDREKVDKDEAKKIMDKTYYQ